MTGDQPCLGYAIVQNGKLRADWGRPTWLSWEDPGPQMYRRTAEAVMCGLLPSSSTATPSRTDATMQYNGESDTLVDLRNFVVSQVDYKRGNNPMKISHLGGYNDNPGSLHVEAWHFPDCSTSIGGVIFLYLTNTLQLDGRTIHLPFNANRWE